MKIVKIWNDNPAQGQLDEVSGALLDKGIVIIPTDSIYALACDALDIKAVEKLCRLKGINPDKTNLSIICRDIAMASEYARIDNSAFKLLRDLCPGAYTFILHAASSLPKAFKRRKTVGIRIPGNEFCRKLAEYIDHPLLVSSIEFDDEDYAVNPELVAERYEGRVDMLVDGGDGSTEPSTVIDCTGNEAKVIRIGKGGNPFKA